MATRITAILGDIVRQDDCQAIVNSANSSLRAGSGVCGAIYRAAGPELEPCSSHLAPLPLAQAVATPGFKLPNRLIIHCRGPHFLLDPDPAAHLALCVENTLKLADREGVRKVAVPAISMGIFAFPAEQAVPILVAKARALATGFTHLEEVRFVVLTRDLLALFQQEIDRPAPPPAQP